MGTLEEAKRADEILLTWERRSTLAAIAHSRSANRCARWDMRLGLASVLLTAIVGTSVVASMRDDLDVAARIVVALLTIAAAGTSAVHTFAALPNRKSAYEAAARRHAAVRRRIESARARLAATPDRLDVWPEVDAIKTEMDAAAAANPNASGRIWDRTRRQLKNEFTWPEKAWARLRGLKPAPLGVPGGPDGPRDRFR